MRATQNKNLELESQVEQKKNQNEKLKKNT